ncbi:hypothetical protein [Aquibacillus salsiterrae]|uniref:Uncharacterized protein n=1 Tax=Aquibacillus salsiterrae TaxID=2950439 RepID=A0A9X3WH56_9BACI|nr:hypothetical protein [Aquibacillus salsiterrae]MDC3418335.1 hypothetical protein [Aquibacillus salsiterrae]
MSKKFSEEEITEFIENLTSSNDTNQIKIHIKDIQKKLESIDDPSLLAEYKKDTVYQENAFSASATDKRYVSSFSRCSFNTNTSGTLFLYTFLSYRAALASR